nr:SRPBCC domain-containing protein [uncultured Dyadobacter sp.]
MKTSDFTVTLLVDQRPEEVMEAVSNPQHWWSGEVTGKALQLNDEFSYRYKDLHYSRQRVVELIPEQKVVWMVTESELFYVEDRHEWTGTKISFEITPQGNKTELRFSHLGLTPAVECFDSCSNTWSQLIKQSLHSLITTGKGQQLVLA